MKSDILLVVEYICITDSREYLNISFARYLRCVCIWWSSFLSSFHCFIIIVFFCGTNWIHLWHYHEDVILLIFCNFYETGLNRPVKNGMGLHSHVPTHTSIYFCMLLSHVQNFIWQVKKFILQFPFCIDHQ